MNAGFYWLLHSQDRLEQRRDLSGSSYYVIKRSTDPFVSSIEKLKHQSEYFEDRFPLTIKGLVEVSITTLYKLTSVITPSSLFPKLIVPLFQYGSMTEDILRKQCYRCLNLSLTHAESRALVKMFDNNGNNEIDGIRGGGGGGVGSHWHCKDAYT